MNADGHRYVLDLRLLEIRLSYLCLSVVNYY